MLQEVVHQAEICGAIFAAGLMDSGSSCLVLPSKDASLFYDAVRQVPALGPVGVSILYIYTYSYTVC